ncbi:MAG: hypothetical protein V4714_11680 [Bacteroidota bacterium]
MIKILEQTFIKEISNGELTAAGIGIDVFVRLKENNEQISAIEIRILHSCGQSINYYLPYNQKGEAINEFDFGAIFSEKGTLVVLQK